MSTGDDGCRFKSQAQRRKFAQLMVQGKISPQTFEEWNRETGSAELPERVTRRRSGKKATTKKRAAKRARKTAAKGTRAKTARAKSSKARRK